MEKLKGLIYSILFISITLIIGIFITATFSANSKVASSSSAVNETITSVKDSAYTVLTANSLDTPTCTIVTVTNFSNGVLINSGNYTQSNCRLTSSGTGVFNNTDWNVSYTYSYLSRTSVTNASDAASSALNTGTSWLTILVVVGFAVAILVILNKGLGKSHSSGEEHGMQVY